jgi:EmrB/QacA subfamily drug resistance transporter
MVAYFIFLAMHLVLLLSSIGVNTVSVAFEEITKSFNTSLVTAGWVMSMYLIIYTVSVVIMGKVGDIFGRKQTFLACTILFVFGSLLAALAPNIQVLILARLIQGLGGGGFIPAATGVITELFPQGRQKWIAISMSVYSIGGIIGPGVGAWLVTTWGWRSIFWFNVPFGILAIVAVIFLLKSGQRSRSRIDLVGAGLLAGLLFTILIGLSQIDTKNDAIGWLVVGILLAAGAVFTYLFVRHEFKSKEEAIVDIVLLRSRPFLASNVYNFVFGACVFGASSFLPLFATSVYFLTTTQAGLVLSIRSVGNIIASLLASVLVMKWSYHKQLLTGTVVTAVTILLMAIDPGSFSAIGINLSNMALLTLIGFLSGIALGISGPALVNSLIDLMPERSATISGLGSMFRQSGGAISIALITVLVQSVGSNSVGFRMSFLVSGILVIATIPLVFFFPERAPAPAVAEKTK